MKRSWTIREEANAITCCAFRNGFLEDLHAGKPSKLLEQPGLSRITDAEMKKLMIESSNAMATMLQMKETDPDRYWHLVERFNETYCKNWEKGPVARDLPRRSPFGTAGENISEGIPSTPSKN
jgi:hypothetical protein